MTQTTPILLFDGVCNFCNSAVNFVIDHDASGAFHFASLQSDVGRELLRTHGLGDLPLSTMVLIDQGRAYLNSDGILRTAKRLGGPFLLLVPFMLIPRPLRDAAYRAFASQRYRLFGGPRAVVFPPRRFEPASWASTLCWANANSPVFDRQLRMARVGDRMRDHQTRRQAGRMAHAACAGDGPGRVDA